MCNKSQVNTIEYSGLEIFVFINDDYRAECKAIGLTGGNYSVKEIKAEIDKRKESPRKLWHVSIDRSRGFVTKTIDCIFLGDKEYISTSGKKEYIYGGMVFDINEGSASALSSASQEVDMAWSAREEANARARKIEDDANARLTAAEKAAWNKIKTALHEARHGY